MPNYVTYKICCGILVLLEPILTLLVSLSLATAQNNFPVSRILTCVW